jgi:hypothetical protein
VERPRIQQGHGALGGRACSLQEGRRLHAYDGPKTIRIIFLLEIGHFPIWLKISRCFGPTVSAVGLAQNKFPCTGGEEGEAIVPFAWESAFPAGVEAEAESRCLNQDGTGYHQVGGHISAAIAGAVVL